MTTCPNISYFTTDPITLVWIILIIINLALVIYTASTAETFENINYSTKMGFADESI